MGRLYGLYGRQNENSLVIKRKVLENGESGK